MRLYRASDALMQHRDAIETHVFGAVTSLFSLQETVTLYDLTNTYFEGQAECNDKAQRGHSKEKRSDSQANVDWLIENKYRYLVVRRGGVREFDAAQAVSTKTTGGETLQLHKKLSQDGKEVELYCHSTGRELKETAMVERFCKAFEAGLQKIVDGLGKSGEKSMDKLLVRIGRLKSA